VKGRPHPPFAWIGAPGRCPGARSQARGRDGLGLPGNRLRRHAGAQGRRSVSALGHAGGRREPGATRLRIRRCAGARGAAQRPPSDTRVPGRREVGATPPSALRAASRRCAGTLGPGARPVPGRLPSSPRYRGAAPAPPPGTPQQQPLERAGGQGRSARRPVIAMRARRSISPWPPGPGKPLSAGGHPATPGRAAPGRPRGHARGPGPRGRLHRHRGAALTRAVRPRPPTRPRGRRPRGALSSRRPGPQPAASGAPVRGGVPP
jgi:hypothetical protein